MRKTPTTNPNEAALVRPARKYADVRHGFRQAEGDMARAIEDRMIDVIQAGVA